MQTLESGTLQIRTALQSAPADILILTVPHGASHTRTAQALEAAFAAIAPGVRTRMLDALSVCTGWFRVYYNSYLIPLEYCPQLWGWIEGIQHESEATGPSWFYRYGAQPLLRFLRDASPDVVIATEVGTCELAALVKREGKMDFLLAACCGLDIDRAWVQPEVDVFITSPGSAARQLAAAGVPARKIHATGMPIDPAFATLPSRLVARRKLGLRNDLPVLLVLFGGAGFGNPAKILPQLQKVRPSVQTVFISGRNARLTWELENYCLAQPHSSVYGWVNNIHEWMAAADLLLSKPGASTVSEAVAAELPLVAFDPLPGEERRLCDSIEQWKVGCWARRPGDIAVILNRLLTRPEDRLLLRANARAIAQPHAARDAARIVQESWQSQSRGEHETHASIGRSR